MADARGALAAAESRGRALSAQFDANEATLADLEAQVSEQAGDFQELLGQFRSAAGETMPEIANSFANFDYQGRVEGIAEIAEARTLPNRAQLERLPEAMIQEMVAQSEVKSFTAMVDGIGPDASNAEADVMRVGVFTAATVDGTKFVEVKKKDNGDTFLQAFKKQPSGAFASSMNSLVKAGPDQIVRAPVDPSKGNLFGILGDLPEFGDRLKQGGPVGAVIMALLAVGLLLGLYQMFTLFTMGGAGLLGTVIGMIITFTSITIYGAGDPKLMAGGISVALMTTVFGLVAAIPLLLVHAVVSAMARGNQQMLDEQAAGLVAEKAESTRGAMA